MRSLNNRWTCPVCSTVLKPQDLRIDGYVERVLAETPAHVEEVEILEDGSYRIVEEEELRQPMASPAHDTIAADAAIDTVGAPKDSADQPPATVEAMALDAAG